MSEPASFTRARAVAYAMGLRGLTADPSRPDDYAAYLALIAPGETPFAAEWMAKASDCGLVAAAIWRATLDRVPPQLVAPYRVGYALVNLHQAASNASAVRYLRDGYQPQGGDVVHLGSNGAGAEEHVYTVVEVVGTFVRSVDGGRRTLARLETIELVSRVVADGHDHVDGGPVRPVLCVYDLSALAEYYRADRDTDPGPEP